MPCKNAFEDGKSLAAKSRADLGGARQSLALTQLVGQIALGAQLRILAQHLRGSLLKVQQGAKQK